MFELLPTKETFYCSCAVIADTLSGISGRESFSPHKAPADCKSDFNTSLNLSLTART